MANKIGTLAWAQQNGGRLTFPERFQFLAGAAVSRLRLIFGRREVEPFAFDADQIRLPDSTAVQNALALMAPLSNEWLVNHNLRTYIWGAIFAQRDQIKFDEELLFIAAILHDLGLTEPHNCKMANTHCFAVEGALGAKAFAAGQNWSAERQDRLAEAITLHLNLQVDLSHGAEPHLLHAGAAFDVAGIRYKQIATQTRDQVLTAHPRHNMKAALIPLLEDQASRRPQSRMALLCANGFTDIIQRTGFPS